MLTIPSDDSTLQTDKKRTPACLSMLIGIGAFGVVLILAAVTGYLLFSRSSRSPATTEAPAATPQVSTTDTQAPQNGSSPTQPPAAATPLDNTATLPAQAPTLPAGTPGISFIITVNVTALNVRSGPGTMYPILITYPKGTQLLAIGRDTDASWFVISIAADQQGWVSTALVTYDFDRYLLPIFPAPPIEFITPTPYGSAILVPPELAGSQPLVPIQPGKRLVSLLVTFFLAGLVFFQERHKLFCQVKMTLRQALIFTVHLLSP